MADDRVRKLAEDALNHLTSELEAGKSAALQNYLATMGRFHHYSWAPFSSSRLSGLRQLTWPATTPGGT